MPVSETTIDVDVWSYQIFPIYVEKSCRGKFTKRVLPGAFGAPSRYELELKIPMSVNLPFQSIYDITFHLSTGDQKLIKIGSRVDLANKKYYVFRLDP